MTDDFVKIFLQCFLQEATVSSSSMGRDVHSSMLSIQHSSANHNIAHLQGALKDGFGEAVMVCDMPKSFKFPSLDSC